MPSVLPHPLPVRAAEPGAPEAPGSATAVAEQPVEQRHGTWTTIVWNDPVNLMSYVSYVFRSYFGYSKEKADELMMRVHTEGRAVVSSGSRERMEGDVSAMHRYGLWATLQREEP
ncbi:ATP-dependent Clp protease adapter ClpS [Aquipuribacter nitratireducens]|uniref:ATP-dependent Clp protease adapter protein ClpS n=1 Tax=Aquipuribacter nitratireducens TaxID=650104 RepID=A0ABW0GQA5_9MICO